MRKKAKVDRKRTKAWRLGTEAGVDHVHSNGRYVPENPYKNKWFAGIWQEAYEHSIRILEEAIEELGR